jgi:hypothetical protein
MRCFGLWIINGKWQNIVKFGAISAINKWVSLNPV